MHRSTRRETRATRLIDLVGEECYPMTFNLRRQLCQIGKVRAGGEFRLIDSSSYADFGYTCFTALRGLASNRSVKGGK